eukprot:jgi/Picsp_1/5858/NSC_03217-R1_carboxymethylenebutenolidase
MGNSSSKNENIWEKHMECEFSTKDVERTMETMVAPGHGAYVNHVPVATGGFEHEDIKAFYGSNFIPHMPEDTVTEMISRTVGKEQIVDEMIFKFTHSIEMPWMLPGVKPTNKHVEVPLVAVIGFQNGKVKFERIYWDQASVLLQIGLINAEGLPILGDEQAKKVCNPEKVPSNPLN